MTQSIRNINKDWENAFPQLKWIDSNKLFEIVGPLLIGIELVKSKFGNQYKPYLIVSSLFGSEVASNRAGNQLKNCLNSPDFYYPLVQFQIDYNNSSQQMNEIIQDVKRQHLPLEQNISLKELLDFIDSNKSHSSIASGGAGAQAYLLELKYLIGVYLGDENLKSNVLKEIELDKKFWNMEHFAMWIGDYNVWISKLKKTGLLDLLNSMDNVLSNSKLKDLNTYDLQTE